MRPTSFAMLTAFATVIILGTGIRHAQAESLLLPITVDSAVTISFDPMGGETVNRLDVTAQSITGDLADYDEIIWEYQAPTGTYLKIDPVAASAMVANVNLFAEGGGGANQYPAPSVEFEFLGLTGTAPTLIYSDSSFRVAGNQIAAGASLEFDQPFAFEGFRLTIQGPFDSTGETMNFDDCLANLYFIYTDAPYSEQIVTSVPEPTSLMMLGIGGLTILGLARQRQRRRQSSAA